MSVCEDPEDLKKLLEIGLALNKLSKCFSEDLDAWRGFCLEGVERASKILERAVEDLPASIEDLEGISRSPLLYEGAHLAGDPIKLRAKLSSLYRSFGVSERGEMADHISVELEFLSLLLVRIFRSGASSSRDLCEEELKAVRIMVEEHGQWIDSLAERAGREASGIARLVADLISNVRRLVSSKPATSPP